MLVEFELFLLVGFVVRVERHLQSAREAWDRVVVCATDRKWLDTPSRYRRTA
jgi:hypothetical protein